MPVPRALLTVLLRSLVHAQDLPPYDLPADVAARIAAVSPVPPFELLAVLGNRDPAVRAKGHAAWEELTTRERCALVRAGLRQGGAVAIGAAAHAPGGVWLDLAETKVAVRASLPVLNLVDTPFDVGDIFHLMDGSDAAAFLTNPGPMPREIPQFLGPLHRSLGPEHFPQVEQLARGDDLLLRQEAAKYLGVLPTAYERLAAFVVAEPDRDEAPLGIDVMTTPVPFVPRSVKLRADGPGYPPLFVALLERLFLSGKATTGGYAVYAFQWQDALTPAEPDRDVLLRVAAAVDDDGRRIAIRGLVQLGGEGVAAALQRLADDESADAVAPWFARAALARGGDGVARARLTDPTADPLALALLWQFARAEAEAALDAAFTGDPDDRAAVFARVLAADVAGDWRGVPMQGLGEAMARRALAHPLPRAQLFELLAEVPAARAPALLRQAIAFVDAETVEAAPLHVLELGGADALALRLHAIVGTEGVDPEAMRAAIAALLRLEPALIGDDAAVRSLLDRIEAGRAGEGREELRIRLAAARGAAVRARMLGDLGTERAPESLEAAGALAAAVAACGVDLRIALRLFQVLGGINYDAAEFAGAKAALIEPLRRGDGPGAILAWLDREPYDLRAIDGLWTLPDGKGMALLRKARDHRENGGYRDAIGQLALGGDLEAKAIVERAIGARLYEWIDTFETEVLTDGKSLDRVPLLLSQFGSNCCTHSVLGSALQDTIECELATGHDIAATVFDRERRRFTTPRDHLRWSRIADRWLVVP